MKMLTSKGSEKGPRRVPGKDGRDGTRDVGLYIGESQPAGDRLRDIVEGVVSREDLKVIGDFGSLGKWLGRTAEWPVKRVAVLYMATSEELEKLQSYTIFLSTLTLILVLPDETDRTVSMGHLLRPRFIDFAGGSCRQVGAVLEKILAERFTGS